jgi:tetratricopeptide (TPR) repeat protein
MKSFFYTSVLCLLLFSCDSGPKLADICASDTEICALFTPDSWCKSERKDTIFVAFSLKQSPTDDLKYQMLVAYEKYAECVAFSTKIEHIKLKEKRTARVKNYLKAKALIKTLSNETKHSNHPDLLFYHWSRYLDEGALAEFLAMEGSALLETPNGQFNLATHYAKRDLNKTLSLLFHALELYQPEQHINVEIFQSLSTIFTDKNKYQQAYIWLKVLFLYDPENKYVKEATLINFASTYQLEREFLNRVALSTLDKILDGKFEAPKF